MPLMPGGFLTAGQGFGHAVVATTAFDESVRFATEGLGMVQSDWLEMELAPGIDLEVRFFHCNARHHTLALARAPFELPQELHHVMFETIERDDVAGPSTGPSPPGCRCPTGSGSTTTTRCSASTSPARPASRSRWATAPAQIAEPWTDDRRYDQISAWGHQPVVPAPPALAYVATEVILTGTGVPHPRPGRAGAGTLVRCGDVGPPVRCRPLHRAAAHGGGLAAPRARRPCS